jgi:hypothetical protein
MDLGVIKFNSLLKDLKSRCQRDPGVLWKENLGDLLSRYDSDPDVNDAFPDVQRAKNAVLEFMLDQLKLQRHTAPAMPRPKLGSKLDEPDSSGIPPLHKAVERVQSDNVALLLANGACPSIKTTDGKGKSAWDMLPVAASYPHALREMRDLLDLNTFARWHETQCFLKKPNARVVPFNADNSASGKDLRRTQSSWVSLSGSMTHALSTWIHVPSTNVHYFQRPEDKRG